MRITTGMMAQNTIRSINNNLSYLSKLQNQADSYNKIEVPSDDPVIAARSLKLKTYISDIQQKQKNADDADSWMKYSDSALDQINDSMQQIRELTVQASNSGTLSEDDLEKYKTQIEELQSGIIEIANSSYSGRYIFSGYNTDEAPFEVVSTAVGDKVTYNGKYLTLGGVVSASVKDSDLISFYKDNMDSVSGQAELTSATYNSFTATSPALDFSITLDGKTKTISLTDGTAYDIDTLVTELQSGINTAFSSSGTNQVSPLVKVSQSDGKVVLTVQDGSSISIKSGTLDVSKLSFTSGTTSTAGSNEEILYKLGSNNSVAVNVEGNDIFGEGTDSFFDTITKICLALDGQTQCKTASYDSTKGVTVTTSDLDLTSLLSDLDEDINTLLTARSDLGAKTNYVELTQNRLEDNYTTFYELLDKNDNIDLAEVSMNLTTAKTVYSASLQAGATVIQDTLLNYLK